MRKTLPLLELFGSLAMAGIAACSRPAPAPAGPPPPDVQGDTVIFAARSPQLAFIATIPAAPRRLGLTHLTGRLYWADDVTVHIFSPVTGRITAVRADVGQPVVAAAALAEISSPDFGQALADARTAEANLTAAHQAFARASDLFAHGAAAGKEVEAARASEAAALAERDRSRSRLALYWGSPTDAGQVYVLRSPLAGVLVERNVNPGQEVRPDQMLANAANLYAPLFVVTDPTRLWLQLDVPEWNLAAVSPGQQLRISSQAFPNQVFAGRISNVGDELDPATRSVRVRGVVENPARLLKAEMYVLVDVVREDVAVAQAGVDVPSSAVFTAADQTFIFVEVAPGRYQRRAVSIGTEKDGRIPILTGVDAGQLVVNEGALLLQSIIEPED
jgi:cobalt-zinc-cadmium efflux system membrane fusion protein